MSMSSSQGLIKWLIKKMKYEFFNKPRFFIGNHQYKKILNSGERYDPQIYSLINWHDSCHLARYEFARTYISKEDTVLDIACGTGYGTAMIASGCQESIGVDISPTSIQYAKAKNSRKNTNFIISDFFNTKITADVVLSFETIEHLQVNQIEDILKKLVDFSRRTLIGSVPYEEKTGDNPYHFLFNLNESSLEYLTQVGRIKFYYQTPDGNIYPNKPSNTFIQNLIFVFEKRFS